MISSKLHSSKFTKFSLLVYLVMLLSLLMSLSACGTSSNTAMNVDRAPARADMKVEEASSPEVAMESAEDITPLEDIDLNSIPKGQQLSYHHMLSLSVKDVDETYEAFTSAVKKHQGLITMVDKTENGYPYAHCEAKIPKDSIDTLIEELKTLGTVENYSVSVENLSNQVVDINKRLEIKEKQIQKIEQLLEQEQSVENVVQLNNTLLQLQTEIEAIKTEQKNVQQEIEYVTLSCDISVDRQTYVENPNQMISASEFGGQLALALQNSIINLVNTVSGFVIWLVAHILEIIFFIALIYGIYKGIKFIQSKRKKGDK